MSNLLILPSLNCFIKPSLVRHCRYLSEQVVTKEKILQHQKKNEETEKTMQIADKFSQMHAKHHVKKPTRPPFVKNIFLGRFDTEMLTYPEALHKESYNQLEQSIESLQDYFNNNANASKNEFCNAAKQLKLYGMEAPQLSDGRELNLTESLRFSEVIAQRSNDIDLLSSEQAVKVLLKYGSERQCAKYLQDITAGRVTMAWCIDEEGGVEPNQFKTHASFDANKKQWVLNGRKLHVPNGSSADLFIVLARSRTFVGENHHRSACAMLVEKTAGGVLVKTTQQLGIANSDISEIIFENTHVPEENLIGKETNGIEILAKVLPEMNLVNSVGTFSIAKKSYNKYYEYCRDISTKKNNLLDTDLVHQNLSDFAGRIYAMESMIYLTSGLLDIYQDQDCELEASITKIFNSEHSASITNHIMHLIGPDTYATSHWANENYRNTLYYLLFNGTPTNSKVILALRGLQFAGIELQDVIKRIRNPLFHTKEVFTRMWSQRSHKLDNPRLTLQLGLHLHPSAQAGAEWLEYSVLRVQYATELMLAHYGVEVVNKHTDLLRLAECVIDIYAMVATIGRASRSYCIGLQHSDYEILLASAFCQKAMHRVKERIKLIQDGPYINNDVAHRKIAERVSHAGRYYPEHPLKRNF